MKEQLNRIEIIVWAKALDKKSNPKVLCMVDDKPIQGKISNSLGHQFRYEFVLNGDILSFANLKVISQKSPEEVTIEGVFFYINGHKVT